MYGEELIEQYDSRDFDDYRTSKARARARGRGTQSVGSEQDSGIGAIGKGNTDSDSNNGVKRRYALSVVDSDDKALSAAQQDYFKDSKVRDENGNLLVLYHGTPNEFTDEQNTLYIAIALESIKKDEVVAQGNTNNGVTQNSRSVANISLAQLFRRINPNDKEFAKYIPDEFLENKTNRSKSADTF